jgi:hypothetical protein
MNKKSTVVIISLSMLMSLSAMAARPSVSKNAANIETLKTQTGQLESDLSNIALTPGPQGEIGEAGVTGATGQDGADGVMYDGAFEGDMQYWNGNAWIMITAPAENADSLSFCDGQPTWTQGGCQVSYEIGDQGPAGGIVFYVSNEGLNGLEAAPADQGKAQWGCIGKVITRAKGTAIGTGEQNTAAIIAGCSETTAAFVASAYGPGWYLPSKDELDQLYLQQDVVGGFDGFNVHHWSSSQMSASLASSMFYIWGEVYDEDYSKNVSLRVRAVRAF